MQMRAVQTAGGNRVRCRLDLRRDLIAANNRRIARACARVGARAPVIRLLIVFVQGETAWYACLLYLLVRHFCIFLLSFDERHC